uniref:Nucleolar protein 10 n=1 Tax=Timema genevievae TaxID=629358 RepID=A0A7R9JXU8_TIMGE|nr:unnamed protein product [Timema genevievae]
MLTLILQHIDLYALFAFQKVDPDGQPTKSAHPDTREKKKNVKTKVKKNEKKVEKVLVFSTLARTGLNYDARFSPEDKYSRQRITIKKRFNLLLTQQPAPVY